MMRTKHNHKVGKSTVTFRIWRDWNEISKYSIGDIFVIKNGVGYWRIATKDGKYLGHAFTRDEAMDKAVDAYIEGVRLY